MRLYIIRHADPDYPNNTLTAAGHLEAAALARRLAGHGLDAIYASPLARAQITARYTADLLKLPVITKDWLIEVAGWDTEPDPIDGGFIPAWDIPGEKLRINPAYHAWETWDTTPPLDLPIYRETVSAFVAEADSFLAEHGYVRDGTRYRAERPNQAQIAAFCHNGTALLWLSLLLHIPPPLVWCGFWHAPSAVTTILFEQRSSEYAVPRALSVGDTSHLHEARLPIQPRGIRGNFR
ncbi:histidine phosphatase family protein [Anaerolineae bacterium CFX9]|jgi:probable phosphoglycerate mutase|nr:histidine phosphatase family protein [Anaerolineae bacterium CFX9]